MTILIPYINLLNLFLIKKKKKKKKISIFEEYGAFKKVEPGIRADQVSIM